MTDSSLMAISSPEMMLVPARRVSLGGAVSARWCGPTKVDVAETAATDLAANAVLVAHAEVLHAVSGLSLVVYVCV